MQATLLILPVALLLVLVWLLQPILTPFLAGIAIAYLGDPVVDRLEARGINRNLGVLIVFLVFTALISAVLLVLAPMLLREVSSLVTHIPAFVEWLQKTTSPLMVKYFGVDPFDVSVSDLRARLAAHWREAGGIASYVLTQVTASGFALVSWVLDVALTPVVAFYLMRDWDRLVNALRALLPRELEGTVVGLVSECDEVLSAFLRGQLLIMLLLGCIYATGLAIAGINLAILIGLLAGLASIVPYLGFATGIVAATAAALFQYHDVTHLIYVVIVFGIGQAMEATVLTPLLVGDRIGLHPVAVIFAVLAGGQLFGFIGVLLALPTAAVIMVFVRHAHKRYTQSAYYSANVALDQQQPDPE